ncbi:MAG: Translation initiation factor IF-2 [Chlamydiae bacterium]|nr:Translation initiation factor IF-2 [Chlamydiota bacterium]
MAKNLKLKIKNAQLAEALQLDKLKKKKQEEAKSPRKTAAPKKPAVKPKEEKTPPKKTEEKEAPLPKEEKKEAAEAPKKEAPTPTEPPKKKGVVDDFRRPKIIRKKAISPLKKSPVTRKDLSAAVKKKPAEKTTATKPATEAKVSPRKPAFFKDYRDMRSQRKPQQQTAFDSRDRMGLRGRDDGRWRKRRGFKKASATEREERAIRPKSLHIRLPISVKDLAIEMKLKASELISRLFMQGIVVTINDILADETTVQLLGHEFSCEITIDTSEEERIKITDKTIKEEIAESDPADLVLRPPVVTFMGHVDHGKTSLIDAIRNSDIASGEAGAITQHIGAFKCHSAVGEITLLDTPGHEAFSAMRERGAEVTDLVILVIAGDEGMRDQTVEAMNKAKEANVPILVAINKSDKAGFDQENIYRQLSEHELLPEAWGGTTITVNCSATSGEGVNDLLEMLSLQSEVLELKSNPSGRARGSVIESAMHKGLGAVATVLVQNGTLRLGDTLVCDMHYAKVKTMHDEHGIELFEAGPSTPVKITGLSGLPEAGSEFISVDSEGEAREIARARLEEYKHKLLQKRKKGIDGLLEQKAETAKKKVLHVILRADVQGSLEALKHSLQKIESEKAELNIVSEKVGQISESDIELAAASGAPIIGFHTKVESHAELMIKEKKVTIKLHDIIYHAVDDVKEIMRNLLDKLPQENEMGAAEVKAVFKSSQLGLIAGCQVTEGIIKRNHHARLKREGEVIWKGEIASLKRVKEDVKEVTKDHECGILLRGFKDFKEGDIIEAYEITYLEQEL